MAGGVNIPPTVTTSAATSVTAITAVLNGNAVDGGQWYVSGSYSAGTVSQRGFYWGTSPTALTNTIVVAGTTGTYSATLTGLQPNTTYYFQAFVIPVDVGLGPNPGYGSILSFGVSTPQEWFYKRHVYKVYNSSGVYIGNLPYVTTDFAFSKDINIAGSQLSVTCAISVDTSSLPVDQLTDESGNILTDESSNILTTEGTAPLVGLGATGSAIIQSGNRVVVWEYGFYHPQGIPMFIGKIERWAASYGGDTNMDQVDILIYSDGQELDNYLVRGNPYTYTLDQTQTSTNGNYTLDNGIGGGAGWNMYGQSFTVGTGVTNVGAISVYLNGTAPITVTLYTSPSLSTVLNSSTQNVATSGATEIQFQFPSHTLVTAGTQLFFTVTTPAGNSIAIGYQNTDVYAGGGLYQSVYGGGSGGGSWSPVSGQDLYFKTFSSVGSTLATYTSQDPTTGMLIPIMNDYIAQGGRIKYTTSSIQATGLSLTYKFNTQTVFEAIQAIQTISPTAFYFTVNLGTNLLTFKKASTTPDVKFTKSRNLSQITIVASTEYVVNTAYVTGADASGTNIYTLDSDPTSVARYGVRLTRKNDSHIQDTTTAHAVGSSFVSDNKNEIYQTTITVLDKTMDITTLDVGMIVGFNGFGTFVDSLQSQIVHIDYSPDSVALTLGVKPHRTSTTIDEVVRAITAANTIANPSTPS